MFEAAITEFPFVAEMPKRDRSKFVKVWDHFQELGEIAKREGMLVPQTYAAKILGVSKQRVWQFVEEGRLRSVEVNGVRFVGEKSLIEFCKMERKSGRPVQAGRDLEAGESADAVAWKYALEAGKEIVQAAKEKREKKAK